MLNPLVKYKSYHKNEFNIYIHQICVPVLLMSFYAVIPFFLSFGINLFYSITFLLFDVFSAKSIQSVFYLQTLFLLHFFFRAFFSLPSNLGIHTAGWIMQIIGHKWFEQNSPAFLDNLYDSLLFGPYFTFLETFHPLAFESKEKYTILKKEYDGAKKSILYFAGLFQKAEEEYKDMTDLTAYNHIYIHTNFKNADIYKDTLHVILEELGELDIECIVGFSFGGSLALQFKALFLEKYKKDIKSVLIAPAGFKSNTFLEKTIQTVSAFLYSFYCNDKWYMLQHYPTYQNVNTLSKTDYLIVSTSDTIHHPAPIKTHENNIVLKHASHLSMVKIVKKQNILTQLIKNDYNKEKVMTKPLTSNMNKLLFGGHFFPYHITLWSSVSIYNIYSFFQTGSSSLELVYGFFYSSFIWGYCEYSIHRYLLHDYFYQHHKKHHTFPNKLSIMHIPMLLVVFKSIFHFSYLNFFVNLNILLIFLPLYYISFEITHLLSHFYKGKNNVMLNAKYYHKLHHVHESTNFSFLMPFWDYFFGTLSPNYKVSFTELLFGFIPFYSFFIHQYIEV
jgi:uncharacterized membrane protein YGL010W